MRADIHPLRLFSKAILLFIIANIVFALIDPPIYKLTAYNTIFPGRVRLPFGADSGPYSVMVDDLDIMVASHEISAPKAADEFRIVILGDSSVWGEGAHVSHSISVLWNGSAYACADRNLKFYNLAYPHPSIIKDLIILDKAMQYEPDMILWFVTLNTLTPRRLGPFIDANAERAVAVLDEHEISFDRPATNASNRVAALYQKTLIGQRSELARWLKLQALSVIWTISRTDVVEPESRPIRQSNDVIKDPAYKGLETIDELQPEILWSALAAGHDIAGQVPVLIVNEPIFIATGMNSHVRYNSGYPRWAYDYYRDELLSESQTNQWHYLDLWDSVPAEYFPDGSVHISPDGRRVVIEKIEPVLETIACE